MKKIKYINLLKTFKYTLYTIVKFFLIVIYIYIYMPSKHVKELIIVNTIPSSNENQFTSTILYNNFPIGTMELNIKPFPPLNDSLGAPYNTKYDYTLIFNKENHIDNEQLNIALDSIETNGFYKLSSGVLTPVSIIGMPIGIYKNICQTPESTRYELTLYNESTIKIILRKICN